MGRPRKELTAAVEALYAPRPSKQDLRLYGGEESDYLPVIELHAEIIESYNLFGDLETQWRVSAAGSLTGLDYSAVPFVMDAHGITEKRYTLRDLRVLEAAALRVINNRN